MKPRNHTSQVGSVSPSLDIEMRRCIKRLLPYTASGAVAALSIVLPSISGISRRQSRPRSLSCGLSILFSYRRSILGAVERQLTQSTPDKPLRLPQAQPVLQESLESASVPALGSLKVHNINSNHAETVALFSRPCGPICIPTSNMALPKRIVKETERLMAEPYGNPSLGLKRM